MKSATCRWRCVHRWLLRACQEREVLRVGSHHADSVDARVIAATHMRIWRIRWERGRFRRRSLYHRLAVAAPEHTFAADARWCRCC